MAKATAKKNSAFMKPVQPSEHLAKIVGTAPLPRTEVTKKIWAHIKKHKTLSLIDVGFKPDPSKNHIRDGADVSVCCQL
jgi:hypothetical protein